MFEQIRANKIKSAVLVVALAVLLVGLGYVLGEAVGPGGGGVVGVLVAVALWVIMGLVSYFKGGDIMLHISGAREIQHKDNPQLFNVVEEMAIAGGLPMPKVYIIDDTAPNAFATGRDPEHACVAITKGLLMKLTRDELQGVMAHEMSHVLNRDILFMTMAGIMVGVVVLLADWYLRHVFWFGGGRRRRRGAGGDARIQMIMMIVGIVLAILAPIVARLLYLAASRRREYLADASAARLTRYPGGLASALEKIAGDREPLEAANRATAPMYIVNPFKGMAARASGFVGGLFSTHPPLDDRVAVLRAMGTGAGLSDYQTAFMARHPGRHVIGKQSLSKAARVELRPGTPEAPRESQADRGRRVLEAMDTVRRMQNFIFLSCACGARLKFPAGFSKSQVRCPRCAAVLSVAAALEAADPGRTLGS